MKINLAAPKAFDFVKTITTLQRGPHDPINQIEQNAWTRCFTIANQPVVVTTRFNKGLTAEILSGNNIKKEIKHVIQTCLGLDDPLLQKTRIKGISRQKLGAAWFISVPGYPHLFEAIVQTIMGQQVSVSVANQMRLQFTQAYGVPFQHFNKTYYRFPEAERIVELNIPQLSRTGISQMKARSILEVAQQFVHHDLAAALTQAKDYQTISDRLLTIYGIGRWTVDWVALRALRQFQVIPAGDLAVRKAFTWWLAKKELLSIKAVDAFTETFHPLGGAIAYRILCAYVAQQTKNKTLIL